MTDNRSRSAGLQRFIVGSYVGPTEPGIGWYTIDSHSAELTLTRAAPGVPFPAYLVPASHGARVYAVGETTRLTHAPFGTDVAQTGQEGSIWFLTFTNGEPAIAGMHRSGGELPTHLTIDPSGRWLVVSNYGCEPLAGGVSIFPIDRYGALGAMRSLIRHSGSGPIGARQSCAHVHSTIFTPSGNELIAADLGADALVTYAFDERTGTLRRSATSPTPAGWGPRYMRWAPDGTTLLVVGELACEVGAFAYERSTSTLRLTARVPTVEGHQREGVLPSDLHVSADGQVLYVANRGAVNTLAAFSCSDPTQLTLLAQVPTGGTWPRDFALSPDGQLAIIANQHSDSLAVLGIGQDGLPTRRLTSIEHKAPSFVEFV